MTAIPPELSRRDFAKGIGIAWISTAISRPLTALAASQSNSAISLGAVEWQLVEQMTARIIPTDQTPGALEAGCVNFIDKSLAAEDAHALPLYRAALRAFKHALDSAGIMDFAALQPDQQDQWLHQLENEQITPWATAEEENILQADFFATLRLHTIFGFLADPKYGGNKDYVGWKLAVFPGPTHHRGGATPEHLLGETAVPMIWEE
jgi:gluconate 2-dehydrogenase gamma chain